MVKTLHFILDGVYIKTRCQVLGTGTFDCNRRICYASFLVKYGDHNLVDSRGYRGGTGGSVEGVFGSSAR